MGRKSGADDVYEEETGSRRQEVGTELRVRRVKKGLVLAVAGFGLVCLVF